MDQYELAYDKIRNLLTTRCSTEWWYIVEQVRSMFGQDISDTEPVFLKPEDFLRESDIFDADVIFTSWHVYKKTPVLLISSAEELEQVLGKDESDRLLSISHFIG